MYKYYWYIIIGLFITFNFTSVKGQRKEETPDTISGKGLVEAASRIFDINANKTEEYALRALEIGKNNDDELLMSKAYAQLVRVNLRLNKNEKAFEYAQLAEAGLTKHNGLYDLAGLYNTLANGNFNMGNIEKFKYYSDKCIPLARQTNNNDALTRQLYTRGMNAYRNTDYYLALDYFNQVLVITEKHPELERIKGWCFGNLSSIYDNLNDNKLAREYRLQSIRVFEKLDMVDILVTAYTSLSKDYLPDNMPDSALYYAKKALQAQHDSKMDHSLATVYSAFYSYYFSTANYDSAGYYIEKSIEIAEKYNRMSSAVIYYQLAGYFYITQEDLDKAYYYSKKAEQLAEKLSIYTIRHSAIKNLGIIFEKRNQLDSAAHYFAEYIQSDTLKNIKKIQKNVVKLSEIRAREQSEFKLREARNKRNILIGFLAGSAILIFSLTFLLRKISKQRNTINLINEDLREHQDELKLLVEYKSRQLDDKEKQYANLCNNMFNGAVFRLEANSVEPLELAFSFVSNGWKTITGLPIDNLNEMIFHFKQNIRDDYRESFFAAIANAFKTGVVVDEAFAYIKNGEKAWFHIRAVPTAVQNQVVSIDGYMVDETEQKIFESKLVAAKERAEEADKLKTAFLNNVSHEIRTPMNAIIGFSSLIIDNLIPEEEKEIFLKTINENCFQLLHIVNDIVEISRIEAEQTIFHFNEITIGGILNDVKANVIPLHHEKYPDIEIRMDENLEKLTSTSICTDRTRLVQVIDYLLSNATKFTPKGYVELGIIPEVDNIHFYVKDSGIGIAPEDIERVFHRFMKINPTAKSGTGLGLPIAKKILDRLRGKIWVESAVNVGTIFHFTIPKK
ncbi:MAG: PAS domain-containing sensor histidine kinase [Cytophagaceae bacterium]|jgi:signal transduction histidine kinase|nr:PAS domain-containing sensor histidine kinase [Cytophagaceae bacterium]